MRTASTPTTGIKFKNKEKEERYGDQTLEQQSMSRIVPVTRELSRLQGIMKEE